MDSADEEDLVGSQLDPEEEWEDVEGGAAEEDQIPLGNPDLEDPDIEDDTGDFIIHLEGNWRRTDGPCEESAVN